MKILQGTISKTLSLHVVLQTIHYCRPLSPLWCLVVLLVRQQHLLHELQAQRRSDVHEETGAHARIR